MKNRPYVKQYDAKGDLINHINGTYRNPFPNRSSRRQRLGRFSSNKKGVQTVITYIGLGRFYKARKVLQRIIGDSMKKNGKLIVHYASKN